MKAREYFSETSVLLGCSKNPPDPADGISDFNFNNFLFSRLLYTIHIIKSLAQSLKPI